MIPPDNKKLRIFHIMIAFVFYFDVIITSIMMGNYEYAKGIDDKFIDDRPMMLVVHII